MDAFGKTNARAKKRNAARRRVSAAVALVALGILIGIPAPAAAELNVVDWVSADADTSGKGQSVMVCTGPFMINCSVAAAFNAGRCADLKIKTICFSLSLAAIGGLSSVNLGEGGGGIGNYVKGSGPEIFMECSYTGGLSGGCTSEDVDFGLECTDALTVQANGYINPPSIVGTGEEISRIYGPTATASAPKSCLLDVILPHADLSSSSPAEAERQLEAMLRNIADEELAAYQNALNQHGFQAEPTHLTALQDHIDQAIGGLTVGDDYEVIWPADATPASLSDAVIQV